jgi:hypothetical protein
MMQMMISNDNLKQNIDLLLKNDYIYIIKAKDKWLSGWGQAKQKTHLQLIACKTLYEKQKITEDLKNDKTMSHVNYYYIDNPREVDNILKLVRNKSYTIRNSWSRAFKND